MPHRRPGVALFRRWWHLECRDADPDGQHGVGEFSTISGVASANREGSLTVIDSNVLENSADGCRGVGAVLCSGGGGIWNSGMLTMQNSTVSGSSADWGGGIFNRGVREPTITNSTVSGNSAGFDGGGLLNFETLTLIDSTVADNSAGQSGGGIANEAGITRGSQQHVVRQRRSSPRAEGIYNPAGRGSPARKHAPSRPTLQTRGGVAFTPAVSCCSRAARLPRTTRQPQAPSTTRARPVPVYDRLQIRWSRVTARARRRSTPAATTSKAPETPAVSARKPIGPQNLSSTSVRSRTTADQPGPMRCWRTASLSTGFPRPIASTEQANR